ncbi:MAG TPA: FAD-dependent oxidoreductase [Gammaproteobacteria bacterium]|mgnify:CR=1 FL=1|nr:FAD-dependent oxidoreductase [Gammaproteobacteria bacterium]
MKELDFLIIGQGLAGSLLAWTLHRQGFSVNIAHDPDYAGASRVAGGMINPITGLRLALADNTSRQLAAANSLYQQIADFFSTTVFYPRKIARLFKNDQEQDWYRKRASQPRYREYLGEPFSPATQTIPLSHELGGFYIRKGGYLDTCKCLDLLLQYFDNNNMTVSSAVKYNQLQVNADSIQWQGLQARQAIFCDGARMLNNPWFDWLPMQALHGDILTLRGPAIHDDTILNFGNWLLPLQGNTYRYGATIHVDHADPAPVPAGRKQLLAELNLRTSGKPFTCLSHHAGVRPATRDRMPFIGKHPKYDPLFIFNGFGSKGSLTIPSYLKQFTRLLCQQKPVDAECDISRYLEACHFD